jgi:UDP-glucose 4-epimerase
MRGRRQAVPSDAQLVDGDISDRQLVEATLRDHQVDAVLHCAGRSLPPESVADPAIYFETNVTGGLALLDAMRATGVGRIVFSSSAAVYGASQTPLIEEDHPLAPVNAYGETKRVFESAGDELKIFGTDYDTPDGTCIRDYIHVLDLADAHISALETTAEVSGTHIACNLGSGSGFSVLEVLSAAESVIGREVPHTFGPRREGDPAVLVASNKKAQELFGWQPRRGTLDEMIGSAWRWQQAHPQGYRE